MTTAYEAMWKDYDETTMLVIVETGFNEPVAVYGPYVGVTVAKEAYNRCTWNGEVGTDYEVFELRQR